MEETLNAHRYTDVLQKNLLPYLGENEVFQQDNAPCHRSAATKQWLRTREIEFLDWPSLSPDLNPIENLWADSSRTVYEGGSERFDSIGDLKNAITAAWNALQRDYLLKLTESMPARTFACIAERGYITRY